MTAALIADSVRQGGLESLEGRLDLLVLARAAAAPGPAKVAEIARDLIALAAPRASSTKLRSHIDRAVLRLLVREELKGEGVRCRIVSAGRVALARALRIGPAAIPADWAAMRDEMLLPFVLGLEPGGALSGRAIATAEGLQAAILVSAFALPVKGRITPVRLRAALAVAALERSFGDDVGSAFGSGRDLPAKAARLLAARLLATPRTFGSDGRLIAALAAEQAGAAKSDLSSLRLALMSSFLWGASAPEATCQSKGSAPVPAEGATKAPRPVPVPLSLGEAGPAPAIPDLTRFATAVLDAAAPAADGWPGNRKAYICDAWKALAERRPEWRLSEAEFKALLVEAHRTGRLALATADLKDPKRLADIQASQVTYKNTVWHFVRVDA